MFDPGYLLDNTQRFANNFYKVLAESLGMSRDVKAEEFEIEDEVTNDESPIITGDDTIVEGDDASHSNFDAETDL